MFLCDQRDKLVQVVVVLNSKKLLSGFGFGMRLQNSATVCCCNIQKFQNNFFPQYLIVHIFNTCGVSDFFPQILNTSGTLTCFNTLFAWLIHVVTHLSQKDIVAISVSENSRSLHIWTLNFDMDHSFTCRRNNQVKKVQSVVKII